MVKVSIIVPLYNAENHLRRSIISLQNQTLEDIEIILVNDGSTDNSLSICKEFEKNDKRIKIIDKINAGVSAARNSGLEIARGEYVGFIDADDWVENEMYEKMYEKVKSTKSDICISDFIVEDSTKSSPVIINIKNEILNEKAIREQIITNMISAPDLNSNSQTIMGSVCRLLIEKELIIKNEIRFPEEISLMEDLIFCINIFLKSKKTSVDHGLYYHYVTIEDSAVRKYREDMITLQHKVFKEIREVLIKNNVYELYEDRLDIRYVNMSIKLIMNEVHNHNYKKLLDKIFAIKKICKDRKLKEIIRDIDVKKYTLRKRATLYAMRREISLYLYLYYRFINYKLLPK